MQNLSVSKTEEVPVKTKVYRGKDIVYILGLSCHAICVTPTLCPISCFFKVNVNALAQWWLFGARKFLLALLPRGTVMFVLLLCWNKSICLSKFVFVSCKRNKRSQLFIWHCFLCAYESFSNISNIKRITKHSDAWSPITSLICGVCCCFCIPWRRGICK